MSFNLDGYIDVAERIRIAKETHPEFSLQCEWSFVEMPDGSVCISAKAFAYRFPNDPNPGIGNVTEPYPGKTQFTRGSEVMNAESSAWGRALVAIGIGASKVASADEVRLAQERQTGKPAASETAEKFTPRSPQPTGKQLEFLAKLLKSAGAKNNDESMVIIRTVIPDLDENINEVRQMSGFAVSRAIEALKGESA